eukprot:1129169-Alexandrium_andersonii.AAC.1
MPRDLSCGRGPSSARRCRGRLPSAGESGSWSGSGARAGTGSRPTKCLLLWSSAAARGPLRFSTYQYKP